MFQTILLFAFLFSLALLIGCYDNISNPIDAKTNYPLLQKEIPGTISFIINLQDSTGQVTWFITNKISVDGKEYI